MPFDSKIVRIDQILTSLRLRLSQSHGFFVRLTVLNPCERCTLMRSLKTALNKSVYFKQLYIRNSIELVRTFIRFKCSVQV